MSSLSVVGDSATASEVPHASSSSSGASEHKKSQTVHYSMCDDAVDAHQAENRDMYNMYNFSNFTQVSEEQQRIQRRPDSEASAKAQRRAERREEMERLEASQAALQGRARALEEQMEAQERKLTAASRQVAKTRNEVKKLTAQVGLKDLQGSKNSKEVTELRQLLVEREEQLQEVLDDCDAALAVPSRGIDNSGEEPPETSGDGPDSFEMSEEDRESMLQLMRITEELTDALETARGGEEDAKKQLAAALAELQNEEAQTEECHQRVLAAREARAAEVAALSARIKEQEQALVAVREQSRALQAGPAGKARDVVEPEGEPAGGDALEPLSRVDITDPEVAAAEKAARAALEAMKLHGGRSAAKAGAEASKVAGHLVNVGGGGLLRNINYRIRSAFATRSVKQFETVAPHTPVGAQDEITQQPSPSAPSDWRYDMMEV